MRPKPIATRTSISTSAWRRTKSLLIGVSFVHVFERLEKYSSRSLLSCFDHVSSVKSSRKHRSHSGSKCFVTQLSRSVRHVASLVHFLKTGVRSARLGWKCPAPVDLIMKSRGSDNHVVATRVRSSKLRKEYEFTALMCVGPTGAIADRSVRSVFGSIMLGTIIRKKSAEDVLSDQSGEDDFFRNSERSQFGV